MINALTVDLEDWYHICGDQEYANPSQWRMYENRIVRSTETVLSILNHFGVKATFFVLGYIAENEPDLIRTIARKGHEIATHGHFHQRIFDLTKTKFEEDLKRSKEIIERVIGKHIYGFRAPEWSMTSKTFWALDIMRKLDIQYDSSMVPLTRMGERGLPSLPKKIKTNYGDIIEFPLTTFRCLWERLPYSGGLPLRIAPYWFILNRLHSLNRSGKAGMVYIHPWEFDHEQPKIELPPTRKFMHYFRLSATRPKLEGLLTHLKFAPMRDVLKKYFGFD